MSAVAPVSGAKLAVTTSLWVARALWILSLNLKVLSKEVRQVTSPKSTDLTVGATNCLRKEIYKC